MENLTLYCNCFPEHENRFTQFNQKNLICGAHKISNEYRNQLTSKSFLFDDVGDNVSTLNNWLGDLTGLYWVWKNNDDEIVGTNQYRRFWHTPTVEKLQFNKNSIYVSEPFVFNVNTWTQYVSNHGNIGINCLYEASMTGKIPIKPDMLNSLNTINYIYSCNMFFADRKLFNKLCEVLFETIFELYEGIKYALPYIQVNRQTRLLAYLSERILNIIYINKNHFLGNVDIVPVKWIDGVNNNVRFE